MLTVLVTGQIPPPFMGQAISINSIIEGKYKEIEVIPLKMVFSKDIDEIGKFKLKKLFHLLDLLIKMVVINFRKKVDILHYPPCGPDLIPMYRDLAILTLSRLIFKKVTFYFHINGVSTLYNRLSKIERLFFRWAYYGADLAIHQSDIIPMEGETLRAKKNIVIPIGLRDAYHNFKNAKKVINSTPVILFVGILRESKGVLVLLDACRRLRDAGFVFQARFMGQHSSDEFKKKMWSIIENHGLRDVVQFLGELKDGRKWRAFNEADIFAFPSFFDVIPRVVIEAMQFEIPVVATICGGIPSVVAEGESGFLVPINDSVALADRIAMLLKDRALREKMGGRGREIYLERFTIERFWRNLEEAFLSLA